MEDFDLLHGIVPAVVAVITVYAVNTMEIDISMGTALVLLIVAIIIGIILEIITWGM